MKKIPLKKRGKAPLRTDWTSAAHSAAEIKDFEAKGYNIGAVLEPSDLVVDVDPRNGGGDSLPTLLADLGVEDLSLTCPTVITGGGGFHYYMTKPPELEIRKGLKRYPGIDFLTGPGRQVVLPPSVHPDTGKRYEFDPFAPNEDPAPPAPASLLDRLKKPTVKETAQAETITLEELKELLSRIPVEEYRDNNEWFNILAASYHATGGAGLEVFLDWSTSDPPYAGHGALITSRWNSLANSPGGTRGVGTLYRAAGAPRYEPVDPREAFTDIEEGGGAVVRYEDALAAVETLTGEPQPEKLREVLKKLVRCDKIEQTFLISKIKARTKISKGELRDMIKPPKPKPKVKAASDGDTFYRVSKTVLDTYYEGGKHLLHGQDQQFWFYTGTHWKRLPQNILKKIILEGGLDLKKEDPDLKFALDRSFAPVTNLLIAQTATDEDLLRLMEAPPSCVNALNGEIWIDPITGLYDLREHSAGSYLTHCLPVEYDPSAKAPEFEKMLADIFIKEKDAPEVVRHVLELIGYTLQPRKNIPLWVLLHGGGTNGKTTLINIITKLLGDAAMSQSCSQFDTAKNSHALAALPGKLGIMDEDFNTTAFLPADFLKKVSENKDLTANPKNLPEFNFKSAATVWIASNSYPRTKDISKGMRRRAMVLPFRRIFEEDEQDDQLQDRIVANELPGVLNLVLTAIRRLRERGKFLVPESCRAIEKVWLDEVSQIQRFISDCCEVGGEANMGELWNAYLAWCTDEYVKHYTKPNLRSALEDLGFKPDRGARGEKIVGGLTLKKTELFNDDPEN